MERIYKNNKKKKIQNLFICQKQIQKLRQTVLLLIEHPCDYPVQKQYTKTSRNHLRRSDRPHHCLQKSDKHALPKSSKIKQSSSKLKSQSSKEKFTCTKRTQSQRIQTSKVSRQKSTRSLSSKSQAKNSNKKQILFQKVNLNRTLSASPYKSESNVLKQSAIVGQNRKEYQIQKPIKSTNTETTTEFSQTNPKTPESLIGTPQRVAYPWISREQTQSKRQFLSERSLQKNKQLQRKPQIKICYNLQSQLEVQKSIMSTVKLNDQYTSPLCRCPLRTSPFGTSHFSASPFSSRYCTTNTPKKQTFQEIQNQKQKLQPPLQIQNENFLNLNKDIELTRYLSNNLVCFEPPQIQSNKFSEFQPKIINYERKSDQLNKKTHKEEIPQFQRIKLLQQICRKTQNFLYEQIAPYKQFLGQRLKIQLKEKQNKPQLFKSVNSASSGSDEKFNIKSHNKVNLWINQD